MVDIETMSTLPEAAVLSIGACAFDPDSDTPITERFLVTISLASNEQASRHLSADTISWWLQQKPEALRAMFEGQITNLRQALVRFRTWAQHQKPAISHIWANDPDFDIVILQSAARSVGELWPWKFWMNRSVRTVGELAYRDPNERREAMTSFRAIGTHHRADDDAIAQAEFVRHCYRILGILES